MRNENVNWELNEEKHEELEFEWKKNDKAGGEIIAHFREQKNL